MSRDLRQEARTTQYASANTMTPVIGSENSEGGIQHGVCR